MPATRTALLPNTGAEIYAAHGYASPNAPIRIQLKSQDLFALHDDRHIRGVVTGRILDAAFAEAGITPSVAPNGTMSRGGQWDYNMQTAILSIFPY
jgi:hypothetical protein